MPAGMGAMGQVVAAGQLLVVGFVLLWGVGQDGSKVSRLMGHTGSHQPVRHMAEVQHLCMLLTFEGQHPNAPGGSQVLGQEDGHLASPESCQGLKLTGKVYQARFL